MDATSDDLADDVLIELGRVTWAAINLEDAAKWLSLSILRNDRRERPRFIRELIHRAQENLSGWPQSRARRDAFAWLKRAERAIDARNAVLHATPLTWFSTDSEESSIQLLGEPRAKNRPYHERPLTAESLSELRHQLVEARTGWRDVVLRVVEARQRDDTNQ
jgi:hypothetical protein